MLTWRQLYYRCTTALKKAFSKIKRKYFTLPKAIGYLFVFIFHWRMIGPWLMS
jgi:hypothetical protein